MTSKTFVEIPDNHVTITNQADRRISEMALHANRVSEFWGTKKPEWAIATQTSLAHTLGKMLQLGGRLMADSRLGLAIQSGFFVCVVPRTLVQVDHRTDEPSVGCWALDTPYIGLFCFHGFGNGTYCLKPQVDGKPTCDAEDHQPMVMGAPIPVEWTCHS